MGLVDAGEDEGSPRDPQQRTERRYVGAHQRADVLLDRKAATLTAWLREHPGVDGPGPGSRSPRG